LLLSARRTSARISVAARVATMPARCWAASTSARCASSSSRASAAPSATPSVRWARRKSRTRTAISSRLRNRASITSSSSPHFLGTVPGRVPVSLTSPDGSTATRNPRHAATRSRETFSDGACPLLWTRARRMNRCARCANQLSHVSNAMFAERSAPFVTLSRHVGRVDRRATDQHASSVGQRRRATW